MSKNLSAALGALGILLSGVALPLVAAQAQQTEPLSATIRVDTSGGYGRLIFTFSDDVDASVRSSGNVLIVSFGKPVVLAVERIPMQASDYVAAARLDPDGRAIRLALARKVNVNSMTAGENYFVDLLPEGWVGAPPALPQDVINELARRAKLAERLERQAKAAEQKKPAQVRVRVASQPTFTRYVFDVPDQTTVSADRANDRLTLSFDSPIAFDVSDATAEMPPSVSAINTEIETDSTLVRFSFKTKVDVRTFRDGKGYVVDVVDTTEGKADTRGNAAMKMVLPSALAELKAAASDKAAAKNPPQAPVVAAGPSSENAPSDAVKPPADPALEMAQTPAAAAPATPHPAMPAPAAANPAQPNPATPEPAKPNPAQANPEQPHPGQANPATPNPAPPPSGQSGAVTPAVAPVAAKSAPDAAPAKPGAPARKPDQVNVEMTRQGANLKLSFPFMAPTAAAIFTRADMLWIVFDAKVAIDLSALEGEASRTIRGAELSHEGDADVVRIRLDHPHLASVAADGPGWVVTIGDTVRDPTRALDITRNLIGPNRASVSIAFEEPHHVHRLRDPEAGDDLLVVTGFSPARGFVNEQDFIEFHTLASTHGVAVEPLADDVTVQLAPDKIVIGRPGGLTLSSALQSVAHASALHPAIFDAQMWGADRQASFAERESKLIAAAAAAPARKRLQPRLDLARFYIAREMYPEAKGVLDVALSDEHAAGEEVSASVLRAVAEVMMDRPSDALKDLANPAVGDQHDAPLWRALAYADQGKWGQARDSFKRIEAAVATLPVELQRAALKCEMRSAVEVGDFAGAADNLNDLETIGMPHDMQPAMSVLIGRLAEGMDHNEDALSAYQTAADSWDRPAAAQGRLREVALRYKLGDLKREDVTSDLETLTTIWRGDDTEVEALEILAKLYTEEGRYRDSFYVMRSAVAARPDSDITRRIQEQAAATFDALFLAGKGDALSAIDALALFYDFRELTPIGRRGDEMIRRLADRLVAVDLLDQAAELLQYQVDHRLEGAARAQVATRLAVIYLINRKPDRALSLLRTTRVADLSSELHDQRLLLEARALSDLGRYDLALDVVAKKEGREIVRLRADILWSARRWAKSAEQIELYYGERWKDWQPLNEVERADILRAAIGYALGEDTLGLGRFREKYAAKMARTPDARAFDIASAPLGTSGAEFREIARAAAAADTLDGFLRDMQARYPDAGASAPGGPAASAAPAARSSVSAAAPETRPALPAAAAPTPPVKAAGRTAQR